jgi:phosphate transport system substrate-binding protein
VFTCIHNPDAINVNWTIYLPTTVEVSLYWDKQLVALPPLSLHNTRGDLKVVGSSTVYPLTRQLAECFSEEGFEGEIAVESTGTLAGFEAFCRGEADLVNASHAITAEYLALCRSMGREPVEFQVGNDALSIAVSQQNDFVEAVTTAELTQILATAERWAEVRPGWPDEPIHRFYPTERSGTFASVVEILFSNDSAPLLQAMNVTSSEDDEVLVESLVKDKFGVGFFGYAYYARNQEQLRTLPVNGVRPIPETVDRGTYPLVRPLFIYSSIDVIHEKPQVAAFINYYLRSAKDYIIEVGYFLPDEAVSLATIERFNEASR